MAASLKSILGLGAVGAAGVGAAKQLLGGGQDTTPSVAKMPALPTQDPRAIEKAVGIARRRGTGVQRPGTLLTGPSGADGPAPVQRATLLGS